MPGAKNPRGNAGLGRKKGVPNRITGDVRKMVLTALKCAGGVQYLTAQAHENPKAFMSLLGKILPTEVKTDGGPILLEQIVLLALERRAEAGTQSLVIGAAPAAVSIEQPSAGASVGRKPADARDPQG